MDLWNDKIGKINKPEGRLLASFFSFFVFSYPIWPQYAIFKVSGVPGLNFQRILFALILSIFAFEIIFYNQSFRKLIKCLHSYRILLALLSIFFIIRLISCIGSCNYSRSLFKVANEMILWGGLVLVSSYLLFAREEMQKHLFSIFFLSSSLVAFLCLSEIFLGHNLYAGWVPYYSNDLHTEKFIAQALSSKVRGAYRIQGAFNHPLGLAQFLILAIPVHFSVALNSSKRFWRRFCFITIPLLLAAIKFTDSRAAQLTVILMFCLLYARYLVPHFSMASFRYLNFIETSTVGYSLCLFQVVPLFFYRLINGVNVNHTWSNETRVDQVLVSAEMVSNNPLLGYGPRMVDSLNVFHKGVIDNYYLSVVIESGIFGLFIFISIIFLLNIKSSFFYFSGKFPEFLFCSILGFTLMCFISSLDHVFPLLFIMAVPMFWDRSFNDEAPVSGRIN